MLCTSIGFIALLVVLALTSASGWSAVPLGGVVVGDVLVVTGFYGAAHVYRENTFTSATIEVATADQKVIATGPYAIVRHPMYASASLYLLGTPLALGSLLGARRTRGHDTIAALAALGRAFPWRAEPARIHRIPEAGRYRLVPCVW